MLATQCSDMSQTQSLRQLPWNSDSGSAKEKHRHFGAGVWRTLVTEAALVSSLTHSATFSPPLRVRDCRPLSPAFDVSQRNGVPAVRISDDLY